MLSKEKVREALSEIEQTADDDVALEMQSDLQFAVLQAIAKGECEDAKVCAALSLGLSA